MTPDQQLMQKVKEVYGSFIDAAVDGTPYPAAFLAALAANESSGDPAVARFEPAVFWQLSFTLINRKQNFGAIKPDDLAHYLAAPEDPRTAVLALVNLATSWGPTQIMGYQALAGKYPLAELPNLQTHFPHAIAMLKDFNSRFSLGQDWNPYFHCWNGGSPTAATFDPNYTAKGLDRMTIYEALE
jgi:hypothetical protein